MSTFTHCNGPYRSDIQASDMVQFANAYSELLTKLNQHLSETVAQDNVHSAKDYIDRVLPDYVKLADLTNKLTAYYTKTEADQKYATKQMIPDLTPYAKHTEIPDITPLAVKADVDVQVAELNIAIQAEVERVNRWLEGVTNEDGTLAYPGVISAGEELTSHLVSFTHAQINPRRYSAYVGGSDDLGVYYLLGMLTDKNGTVYVKYQDDEQFSAVVHFAVQEEQAALSVTCANNGLHWLKFFIVRTSDADGELHYYLAAQAKEWLPTFASTDGVGYHKLLAFESGGINFAPVDDPHWVRPNGAGKILCECMADTCFSASEILTYKVRTDNITSKDGKAIYTVTDTGLVFGDTGFEMFELLNRPWLVKADGTTSPFVTAADVANIGEIIYWPKFEIDPETQVARAIEYPASHLATDGSRFDPQEYPKLYEFLGTDELPLIDYCIIRAKEISGD